MTNQNLRVEVPMKKNILLLSTLIAFNFVHASEDLSQAMKVMGQQFKTIGIALQKKSVGQAELDAAEMLQVSILDSTQTFPDHVTTNELQERYLELMGMLDEKAQELRDAIEQEMNNDPQDIGRLMQIFMEMNQIRQQGHNEFKLD